MSAELHNMSVPATSRIAVRRATLAGRRFRVDLASGVAPARLAALQKRIARSGWRALASVLDAAGLGRPRGPGALASQLEAALVRAGIPPAVGVFLEEPEPGEARVLDAAAALAVLARRSGPLYLPCRRFEPSLVRLTATCLFFPEPPDGDRPGEEGP